jgi:hypothetical protein
MIALFGMMQVFIKKKIVHNLFFAVDTEEFVKKQVVVILFFMNFLL